jgi:lysophospholipase L1-like esterase
VIGPRPDWIALAGVLLMPVAISGLRAQAPGAAIELRSGDRVVFIGDSFFEREYRRGLIETALTVAHPDKSLTFRNLGWSGDTVRGEARAYFGKAADGYAELLKSIELAAPTVMFLSYGTNESFDGTGSLDAFLAAYGKLLDDLAPRNARTVLLSPVPVDAATSPLPPAARDARNAVLSRYSEAILALAASRGLASIDVFSALLAASSRTHSEPLFEHGMHLTDAGYAVAARQIAARTAPSRSNVADGREARLQELRALIVRKNELFFHRWRPANVTYLYLFRQREQGNNAVEIPRFDPLVADAERQIAALRETLLPPGGAGGGGR